MEQQITPSTSAPTGSGAIKAAASRGKSSAKGMFAALLSIIEGKGKTEGGTGNEKVFEQLAIKSGKTVIGTPIDPKSKTTQKKETDIVIAEADGIIIKHAQVRPIPAATGKESGVKLNAKADAELEEMASTLAVPATGMSRAAATDSDELTDKDAAATASGATKRNSGNLTAQAFNASDKATKTNAGGHATRSGSSVTNTDEEITAPKTNTNHNKATASTRTSTGMPANPELQTIQGAANAVMESEDALSTAGQRGERVPFAGTDTKRVRTASRKETNQIGAGKAASDHTTASSAIRHESTASEKTAGKSQIAAQQPSPANDQPHAGTRPEIRQPASAQLQPEKGVYTQAETGIAANLPQQRLSTNHFVKNRKVNLDNLSRAQTKSSPAANAKKPDASISNSRQIFMPQGEPTLHVSREMGLQADLPFRAAQQISEHASGGQPFQFAGIETAASRTTAQPLQAMAQSGPWSVSAAMQQIGQAAGQGKFQLELTLNPEHLGKIQVFLDSDANKQIQVHMIIDQPASRQSIEQHLPMLRQALADQGLNMDSFSMASSGEGSDNPQQQEQQHLPTGTAMAESTSQINERPVHAPADSRLSIRI